MIKNTGHCFHGNHRKNQDGQKCFKQSLSSPKCWHIMKLGFILKPGYVYLKKFFATFFKLCPVITMSYKKQNKLSLSIVNISENGSFKTARKA